VADTQPSVVRCWRQAEPVRTLPNLQAIPILIVTSEAGYHSSYDNCTSGVPDNRLASPNTHVSLGTSVSTAMDT